jgi:uncharacterized membrane protein (DUF2068 family)
MKKKRRRPLRTPLAVDETHDAGLRAIAIVEALKGVVVLLLAFGLLSLLHKDVEDVTENMLFHMHISPVHRFGEAVLRAASKMTDTRLWEITIGGVAYSLVRFIEAWGLWNRRVWAEWFALLSGAMYLPLEIAKLLEKPNGLHLTIFATNVMIVLYMLYVRLDALRAPAQKTVSLGE